MVLASPPPVKTKPFVEVISRPKLLSNDCFKISSSKQIFYQNIPMRMGVTFSINQLETAKSYAKKAFLSRGLKAFILVYEAEKMVTIFYQIPHHKAKLAAPTRPRAKQPEARPGVKRRKYRGRVY